MRAQAKEIQEQLNIYFNAALALQTGKPVTLDGEKNETLKSFIESLQQYVDNYLAGLNYTGDLARMDIETINNASGLETGALTKSRRYVEKNGKQTLPKVSTILKFYNNFIKARDEVAALAEESTEAKKLYDKLSATTAELEKIYKIVSQEDASKEMVLSGRQDAAKILAKASEYVAAANFLATKGDLGEKVIAAILAGSQLAISGQVTQFTQEIIDEIIKSAQVGSNTEIHMIASGAINNSILYDDPSKILLNNRWQVDGDTIVATNATQQKVDVLVD